MLILCILLLIIILFILFLPNRIEFNFANNFWEFRFENLFFKSFLDSKEEESKIEEEVIYKETVIASNSQEIEKSEPIKSKSQSFTQKTKRENKKESSKSKQKLHWLEFIKETWEKEEKTVRALLKFVVKIIKLSQKLLTPTKITLNVQGGFNDPSQTGWLYSIFILFNSFFENNSKISLDFTPNFVDLKWKYDGQVKYCFSIARILLFVIAIIFCVPFLSIGCCLWRNRKIFG